MKNEELVNLKGGDYYGSGCAWLECECDGSVGKWTEYYCSTQDMLDDIESTCASEAGRCDAI